MKVCSIFFPTDLSGESLHALPFAAEMARTHNAKLYILHVIYDLDPAGASTVNNAYLGKVYDELETLAKRELAAIGGCQGDEIDQVECHVTRGQPSQEILRFAREKEVDLIVIGSHGANGRDRVKFGSVAERVVRRAPCPVLTVV